jgi:predicted O-linked N-acetylglucosamine transferase (SPINDLY family)
LPATGFVFCSFNASYKLTPPQFASWMRILAAVPGSVLWLLARNTGAADNLRREARARGIAGERLVFAGPAPYPEYLARYQLADLFLDSLPFNAGATASDALWAGLPVLTCSGEAFAARMAGSLLQAIGLPELATDSMPAYEALAIRLASDAAMHRDVKAKLAQHRDRYPLFDSDRFRREIEAAYHAMWQRYLRGEPPGALTW